MANRILQVDESKVHWLKLFVMFLLLFSTGVLHGRITELSISIDKINKLNEKVILIEEVSHWNEKQIIEWQKKVNEHYYKETMGGK